MSIEQSRRPVYEPSLDPIPAEIHENRSTNTRVAVGLRWSLLVAEIERDAIREPVPNPWSPNPEEAA